MAKTGHRCTYATGHELAVELPGHRSDDRIATHLARGRTPDGHVPWGSGLYGGAVEASWNDDGDPRPLTLSGQPTGPAARPDR